MSNCITGLHLEQPPAFVHSKSTDRGKLWTVRCVPCNRNTTVHPLLSGALEEWHRHCTTDHLPILSVVA